MYPLCIKLIGLNQFIYLLAHFCSVSSPHFPLGAHMISSNTFCRAIYLSLVPRHFVRPCHRARALGPGQSRPAHPTRHPQLARHAPPGTGLQPSTLCSQRLRCLPHHKATPIASIAANYIRRQEIEEERKCRG